MAKASVRSVMIFGPAPGARVLESARKPTPWSTTTIIVSSSTSVDTQMSSSEATAPA